MPSAGRAPVTAPAPAPGRTGRRGDGDGRGRWLAARLLAELGIIFIGVTAAFLVENYRQDRQDQRRAEQHAVALYNDLAAFTRTTAQYAAAIRTGLDAQTAAEAAGERPAPYVLRVPGAEAPPLGVWDAVLQSGAGQVMDPDLIIELSAFYNEAAGETVKYQRYALFTEQRVWPLLAAGDTAAFYDPRSGRLRPEFTAHRWQLEEIVTDLESQAAWAGRLADRIAARYPVVLRER